MNPFDVTPEIVAAYADATGSVGVPPTLAFVAATGAIRECLADLAGEPAGVLHLRHFLELHAPLPLCGRVFSRARLVRAAPSGAGTLVTVTAETVDAQGVALARNEATVLLRGIRCAPLPGAAPRTVTAAPRGEPVEHEYHLPADQPARYAAVSGDDNPIHLDDAAARAAGLAGRVVHGMAVLAYAVRAAGSDVRAVSCRFAGTLAPDSALRVSVWSGGDGLAVFRGVGPQGSVLDGAARLDVTGR
jgi:acyl dehydratase